MADTEPSQTEPTKLESTDLKRKAPETADATGSKRPKLDARATKRLRLPPNYKPSRRPIPHPALPTPFVDASSPKVVYMKSNTPFIPTVKRIRGLLRQIEKRGTQSLSAGRRPLNARTVEAAIANSNEKKREGPKEAVYVKATGRAIEKALEVGLYFQEVDGGAFGIQIQTGTVEAVDDVVEEAKRGFLGGWVKKKVESEEVKEVDTEMGDAGEEEGGAGMEEDGEGDEEDEEHEEDGVEIVVDRVPGLRKLPRRPRAPPSVPKKAKVFEEHEVPETRSRLLNVVSIAISLR